MNITTDAHYMIQALNEGLRGLYSNPKNYGSQVGSVLVDQNGKIIAKAYNKKINGIRKHAEEIILSSIPPNILKESTLYVTVEPCNGNPFHTRKHCCEQIVDAEIKRVVIGMTKQKYEGGLNYIKSNGIPIDILENKDIMLISDLIRSSHRGQEISDSLLKKILTVKNNILMKN